MASKSHPEHQQIQSTKFISNYVANQIQLCHFQQIKETFYLVQSSREKIKGGEHCLLQAISSRADSVKGKSKWGNPYHVTQKGKGTESSHTHQLFSAERGRWDATFLLIDSNFLLLLSRASASAECVHDSSVVWGSKYQSEIMRSEMRTSLLLRVPVYTPVSAWLG